MTTHDFTHPVDTTPPKVCVIVIYHRDPDHRFLVELLESLQNQSYPNIECITFDNRESNHRMGHARNLAVQQTDAPLCLFMAEDDMLVVDTIQSMVDMYQFAKRGELNHLVHVTTRTTALLEHGQTVQVPNLNAPGMYERQYLLANPFDPSLDLRLDELQAGNMARLAQLHKHPVTFATTHHYGYILRAHPFRRDTIRINQR